MRSSLLKGLPVVLGLLGACQQQVKPTNQSGTSDEQLRAQAVLLVHWAKGGDYSREYATLDDCNRARQVILDDAATRTRIASEVTKKEGVAPDAEPISVPLCIPT
jgi:hypothetical protein